LGGSKSRTLRIGKREKDGPSKLNQEGRMISIRLWGGEVRMAAEDASVIETKKSKKQNRDRIEGRNRMEKT